MASPLSKDTPPTFPLTHPKRIMAAGCTIREGIDVMCTLGMPAKRPMNPTGDTSEALTVIAGLGRGSRKPNARADTVNSIHYSGGRYPYYPATPLSLFDECCVAVWHHPVYNLDSPHRNLCGVPRSRSSVYFDFLSYFYGVLFYA